MSGAVVRSLNSLPFFAFLVVFSLLILLFFAYPLVLLLVLGGSGFVTSLENRSFMLSIEVTLIISTITSVFAVLFGVPLGYVMARYDFKFKSLLETLIDIPIVIPHIVVGLMVLLAFSSQYGVGPFLHRFGITVLDTIFGAILAVSYLSSTYTIKVVESSIAMVDPEVELVSRSLGASRFATFFRVTIPSIKRSILNGALLTWARATSEAGALFIIAYYVFFYKKTVYPSPIFIYESYITFGILQAVKFAAALVIIVIAIFILFRAIFRVRGQIY